MKLINKIICFFFKHPCEPTGRRGIILEELKCQRCGGFYVSNESEHPGMLLEMNNDFDRLFKERMNRNYHRLEKN